MRVIHCIPGFALIRSPSGDHLLPREKEWTVDPLFLYL
jgi:hypothetical protein